MNNDHSQTLVQKTIRDIKDYLQLQVDYLKLDSVEKLVKIVSLVISSVLFISLGTMIMIFLGMSLAYFLSELFNSYALGFLFTGLAILAFTLLLYVLRKQLITEPILSTMLKTAFDSEFERKENIKDKKNLYEYQKLQERSS